MTRSLAWRKPVPKRPLHAEHALARAVRRHVVGHHREPPVVPHRVDDAAAHAAVGAGGLDAPLDPGRRLLGTKGAGGAGGDALAAGRADRRRHEAVAEDADALGVAPAHEADRADPLDVVARRRAAPAEDAGLAVEDEERLRVVDRVPVKRRPARRREPVARRRLAQLAEAVAAVACGEHRARQIEDAPPEAHDSGRVRAHRHPVARRQVAGGGEAALALDLHQAGAAGAERRPVGILAELGKVDPEAVHGVEHRGALGHLHRPSVDGQPHGPILAREPRYSSVGVLPMWWRGEVARLPGLTARPLTLRSHPPAPAPRVGSSGRALWRSRRGFHYPARSFANRSAIHIRSNVW